MLNRKSIRVAMLILSFCSARALGEQPELKVVVPGVHAYAGVPAGAEGVLSDLLLNALLVRHGVHALGPADVRAMLTAEQQKNLLGCGDSSCMADLAGALGADWLIGGSVGRLEDLYVLSLQLIDARQARVAARASVKLKSLKQAADKIGPLVDKLLGQRSRPRPPGTLAPVVMQQQPAKKHESLDRSAFCKLNREYAQALCRPPYDPKLVELRRKILLDLVLTPFQREFDNKRSCIWKLQGRTAHVLRVQLDGSPDKQRALDAKRRLAEYGSFIEQVEIVQDEYVRALKMEKNGAGTRLSSLPFEVKKAHPLVAADSEQIRVYRAAYRSAVRVLDKVFEAARKRRLKALRAQFSPPNPARSSTRPPEVFRQLGDLLKQGYRLQVCPLEILPRSDLVRAARRYKEKQIVEGLWVRLKKDFALTDRVWLVKRKGGWKIDRW